MYWEEFVKGVVNPNEAQIGNLALQAIATQSGGRVLNSNNNVAMLIATAAAEADAYYVLTIDTAPADHPDDTTHSRLPSKAPGSPLEPAPATTPNRNRVTAHQLAH